MRRYLAILVVAGAAACAGRAQPTTLSAATYSCGSRQIHFAGDRVQTPGNALAAGWRDDEGRHYVAWPTGTTTLEAVEYVIPSDTHMDAVERVYDTSRGTSRVDWRVVQQNTCTANGGYTDALALRDRQVIRPGRTGARARRQVGGEGARPPRAARIAEALLQGSVVSCGIS